MAKQTDRTAYPLARPGEGSYILGVDPTDTSASPLGTTKAFRYSPPLSVKDFGAIGDGVADDTAAIQSAIDFVEAYDNEVIEPIYLPRGIYRVTAPLTTNEDFIRIIGAGRGRSTGSETIIRGATAIVWDGGALATDKGVFTFGEASDQATGPQISDMSIICGGEANGIYGFRTNFARFERLYIDQPLTGIVLGTLAYSSVIDDNEVYDPVTGGFDFRESCHSCSVTNNQLNGDSGGTKEPSFGMRVAQDANCSAMVFLGNNFDFYRVTDAHFKVVRQCRSLTFSGNYIECRGDGVTAGAIKLSGGDGVEITGNRITKSNTPTTTAIDYGVQIFSGVAGINISGNWFSGWDTACVRAAPGATNINFGANATNGLTGLVDQNTDRRSVSQQDGEMRARTVTADCVAYGRRPTYTVASGVVTIGKVSRISIDAGGGSVDVDTINVNDGAFDGQRLVVRAVNGTITLKDTTGNILTSGDLLLNTARDRAEFEWDAVDDYWVQIAFVNN